MADGPKKLASGWLNGRTSLTVTSGYGHRNAPRGSQHRGTTNHRGIDIAALDGESLFAPFDGVLEKRNSPSGYGTYCVIKSGGTEILIGHMQDCVSGGSVRKGQYIGKAGHSGNASGPHVHLEYKYNGQQYDPTYALGGRAVGRNGQTLQSGGQVPSGILINSDIERTPYSERVNYVTQPQNDGGPVTIQTPESEINNRVLTSQIFPEQTNLDKWVKDNQVDLGETSPYNMPVDDHAYSEDQYVQHQTSDDEENNNNESDNGVGNGNGDGNGNGSGNGKGGGSGKKGESQGNVRLRYKEGLAPGIWQIIKTIFDSSVSDLVTYDVGITTQTGQISGLFNKICQRPFVEFSGDTFGDQYYFTFRRPPFDKLGMQKTMEVQNLLDPSKDNENEYVISEADIISSQMQQTSSADVYSWYQFYPQYDEGVQDRLQWCIPAVLFPEYASMWGSKEMSVRSIYRSFVGLVIDDKGQKSRDYQVSTSINDLHYMIESTAYNPFVRSGSITIEGNRKIKRGMFIKVCWLSGINEVFYVDSVSNNYTIATGTVKRTTTLNLSHGMIYEYLDFGDYTKDKKKKSYFNIIDFGTYKPSQSHEVALANWEEKISSWKVNREVFMFFLQKRQFLNTVVNKE